MRNLPRSMQELALHVGLPATIAIVREYGGRELKVPMGLKVHQQCRIYSRLVEIMGADPAKRFMAVYGGERMTIPRCTAALRDERDLRIIAEADAGRTVAQLAEDYGMTTRNIFNILKRSPATDVRGLEAER